MCHLAQVSRAGFYRSLQEQMPAQEDMEVRSAIQQIVLEHRRRYGYRRVLTLVRLLRAYLHVPIPEPGPRSGRHVLAVLRSLPVWVCRYLAEASGDERKDPRAD